MLPSLLAAVVLPSLLTFTPQELWQAWPQERFVTTTAPCLGPEELADRLLSLAAKHPQDLRLEEVGRSFLDRPIHLLTLGRGPKKILLWSQMHGDEPSATPALLDLVDYLLSHAEEEDARAILDGTTLLLVPMLNPDGSELYLRRNAQDIDINRDALNLATPEGRLLKKLRDTYEPLLGFNLHDQNRRTAVGNTGVLATNAVLAVAGDPAGTLTPGRLRAKRACAAIIQTLAPFMPGGMARYDEDWSPRAFGDNLTAWGTPGVLIESGGLPPGRPMTELTRLNFVALLTVLRDLVKNDLANHDPQLYEVLPRNQSDIWVDVVVRGGSALQPGTEIPYRTDLAFNLLRDDRDLAGCPVGTPPSSRIMELGDSRFLGSGRTVDATGHLVVAPLIVGVEGWEARHWLDEETLGRLARLGVGRVRWRLEPSHRDAARALARRLEGIGRARIEVLETWSTAPSLILSAPPPTPKDDSLAATLAALGGGGWFEDGRKTSIADLAAQLWPGGTNPSSPRPGLRRGQAASFLLLRLPPAGSGHLKDARLEAVWLNGVELAENGSEE